MKNTYKYFRLIPFVAILLTFSACKKDKFLNVNNNPNSPATVDVKYVLPVVESNIGYMIGNQLEIMGGLWAQYWTQDPANGSQYGSYDSYINVSVDNDNMWATFYTAATNLNYIITTADSTEKNYAAIAYFMKAYDFQVLTDAFGKVPLTQSLQGKGNLAPKYDDESQVYDSIAIWVKTGLALIDPTRTSPSEDLIYPNADMAQWKMFANTLLLKIYIRQGQVRPTVAQAGIQALVTGGATFLTTPSTDDAMLRFQNVIYQRYPLYATGLFLQVNNIMASSTAIDYMANTLGDTRTLDFYDAASATGNYAGIPQGSWKELSGRVADANYSLPNSTEIISPTSSIRFLTSSESFFLQAEAAARGWLTGGNAGALYNSGISASWASWPNAAADTTLPSYLVSDSVNFANASTLNQQIRLIITQKWVSMCGNQNFESWTEWRRTRYPDFFIVSHSSVLGSTAFPRRLVYPSAEVNNNSNFPGLQSITTKVWWDLNP